MHRRALSDFEHVPAQFISWFVVPSLQLNVLYELVQDLAVSEADGGDVPSYASARPNDALMSLEGHRMALHIAE